MASGEDTSLCVEPDQIDLTDMGSDCEKTVYTDAGSIAKASLLSPLSLEIACQEKLAKNTLYTFTTMNPCPTWDFPKHRKPYHSILRTIHWDTLETAKLIDQGQPQLGRICVLNMANEFNCGGGFERAWGSQEESLFRRSSIGFSLWPHRRIEDIRIPSLDKLLPRKESFYPLTECGGIYSPNVAVMRNIHGYSFHSSQYQPEERYLVSMLTVAAQDLRYWLPHSKPFDKQLTREKIRTILWMAASNHHTCLVLGAMGCGAFKNDPKILAPIFSELLEGEFKGVFQLVLFAVIKSEYNLSSFSSFFEIISTSKVASLQFE